MIKGDIRSLDYSSFGPLTTPLVVPYIPYMAAFKEYVALGCFEVHVGMDYRMTYRPCRAEIARIRKESSGILSKTFWEHVELLLSESHLLTDRRCSM